MWCTNLGQCALQEGELRKGILKAGGDGGAGGTGDVDARRVGEGAGVRVLGDAGGGAGPGREQIRAPRRQRAQGEDHPHLQLRGAAHAHVPLVVDLLLHVLPVHFRRAAAHPRHPRQPQP